MKNGWPKCVATAFFVAAGGVASLVSTQPVFAQTNETSDDSAPVDIEFEFTNCAQSGFDDLALRTFLIPELLPRFRIREGGRFRVVVAPTSCDTLTFRVQLQEVSEDIELIDIPPSSRARTLALSVSELLTQYADAPRSPSSDPSDTGTLVAPVDSTTDIEGQRRPTSANDTSPNGHLYVPLAIGLSLFRSAGVFVPELGAGIGWHDGAFEAQVRLMLGYVPVRGAPVAVSALFVSAELQGAYVFALGSDFGLAVGPNVELQWVYTFLNATLPTGQLSDSGASPMVRVGGFLGARFADSLALNLVVGYLPASVAVRVMGDEVFNLSDLSAKVNFEVHLGL